MTEQVILDCDPGTDDAVALWLALASPAEIDLAAVTVVAGNVALERTLANALAIVAHAGAAVPVHAGADRPLLKPLVDAAHVHGPTGLLGADLPPAPRGPAEGHAVDVIRARLRGAAPASVTLCAIGPLTNVALALATEPAIVRGLKRIVLMGGAIGLGNVTPAAEFNIHADPQAAAIVFGCGAPIVMVPLDLTHRALATPDRIAAIRALGNPVALAAAGIMTAYPRKEKFGDGGPVHDACAVAWLIRPDLMRGRDCHVEIDSGHGPGHGRTIMHWWGSKRAANALVLDQIDAAGFFALLTERLGRY